ncbi:MAG: phosphoribosylanthranilate isomerase [Bacillota bacterium]|nr:phosphoribosylanthranilate isomerase [Bacillota bacterium]
MHTGVTIGKDLNRTGPLFNRRRTGAGGSDRPGAIRGRGRELPCVVPCLTKPGRRVGDAPLRKRYQIKICGITNRTDLEAVGAAGVDWAGVILEVGSSPRSVGFSKARALVETSPLPVLILTDRRDFTWLYRVGTEISPAGLQLLGESDPGLIRQLKEAFSSTIPSFGIWQSFHLPPAGSFHGNLSLTGLINEITLAFQAGLQAAVLDTAVRLGNALQRGGTGLKHDWKLARILVERVPGPVFLAGGITPDNVQTALNLVDPAGVDLSSGVEASPGKKDLLKIQSLVRQVRGCAG